MILEGMFFFTNILFQKKLKFRGSEYDLALYDFRETAHWMHIFGFD